MSGWGRTTTHIFNRGPRPNDQNGLSKKLKFTQVTIVEPQRCTEEIKGDGFLNEIILKKSKDKNGEWPIICAAGINIDPLHEGYSNTCGGDSGKYFCFKLTN